MRVRKRAHFLMGIKSNDTTGTPLFFKKRDPLLVPRPFFVISAACVLGGINSMLCTRPRRRAAAASFTGLVVVQVLCTIVVITELHGKHVEGCLEPLRNASAVCDVAHAVVTRRLPRQLAVVAGLMGAAAVVYVWATRRLRPEVWLGIVSLRVGVVGPLYTLLAEVLKLAALCQCTVPHLDDPDVWALYVVVELAVLVMACVLLFLDKHASQGGARYLTLDAASVNRAHTVGEKSVSLASPRAYDNARELHPSAADRTTKKPLLTDNVFDDTEEDIVPDRTVF